MDDMKGMVMQACDFKILKGEPLPNPTHDRHGGSRGPMYPFPDMDIGDAFDAPRDMGMIGKRDARQNSISSAAHGWALRNEPERAFATRLSHATVRCWRIR